MCKRMERKACGLDSTCPPTDDRRRAGAAKETAKKSDREEEQVPHSRAAVWVIRAGNEKKK